jgi:hypothetical protein
VTRPSLLDVTRARQSCELAIRNERPVNPKDVLVLIEASRRPSAREIDVIVDEHGLDQHSAERVVRELFDPRSP